MRPFSAFSAEGRWFRGNCHAHTPLSDGKHTAEHLAKAYRSRGYHFLVLTDHDACQPDLRPLQRPDFLVIGGVELHPPSRARPRIPHLIIGIGLDRAPARAAIERDSALSLIRWIQRHGGIAVYGHPYWSGHHLGHLAEAREAFGAEVYNTTSEVVRGLGDSSVHLDQALSQGFRWRLFAVDDVHDLKRDGFGGWIMVKARRLTRRAILAAILKGRFYASCGPEIRSLGLSREVVRLTCSPVREVVWHAVGPHGVRMADGRGRLTRAEFDLAPLRGKSHYLRVELTDAAGRKAWSNPIWWNPRTRRWED